MIAFQVSIVGKPDDTFRLGSDVGNAYVVEATSEEMRRSASQLIVNLINGQGSLWNIRGSQMQTFLRMEALARKIWARYLKENFMGTIMPCSFGPLYFAI